MRIRNQLTLIGGLALGGLGVAGALRAFPDVTRYHLDASTDVHAGGGDLWGNGSARDFGIQCAHCHIDDEGQQGNLQVVVSWSPPLAGGDTYAAGQAYRITLKMVPSTTELGAGHVENENGFTATIEDETGATAGTFRGDLQSFGAACPPMPALSSGLPVPDPSIMPGATSFAYGDCHAVGSLGRHDPALTEWSFQWQAPAAAGQALTLHYGVVDGDGDHRSLGDDVALGEALLH